MKPMLLSAIAEACEARLVGDDRPVLAVCIDSRQVPAGSLFIALRGERFDGHAFAEAAVDAGAAALLVSRPLPLEVPQVLCADTALALGDLAAAVSRSLPARRIGITGSNGKTTVKTLVHAVLSRCGSAYVNPGNRNNEIGLPLAVLDQPEDATFAVYEMGAGQPGDIAYLAAIARPDVALVNNIGPAHLERMGSLLGIAETKGAIYEALPSDGVAVINADDAFAPLFAQRAAPRRVLRFGLEHSAEVCAEAVACDAESSRFRLCTPQGAVDIVLPLVGRHNVLNALAAAAVCLAAGAPLDAIADGLGAAPAVAGRLQRHRLASGAWLIDDSYNANPASVGAAIQTLVLGGGEGWLVLGDMRELGPDEATLHAQIGAMAKGAGVARLFTVGALAAQAAHAFGEGAERFADQDALVDALRAGLRDGVRCLVKGSRSSAMDRVVRALQGGTTPEDSHAV